MSAAEQWPDESGGVNWGELFDFQIDTGTIPLEIVLRHDEQLENAELKGEMIDWKESVYLPPKIITPHTGNEVAVEVRKRDTGQVSTIRIGHYSPVEGGFLLYPDLVREEEVETIKAAAFVERERLITRFNASPMTTQPRYDYEDPKVQIFHRNQHTYLDSRHLIIEVVDALVDKATEVHPAQLHGVDSYTEAALFLRTQGGQSGHYIGMRFAGALKKIREDFWRRQPATYVDILSRVSGSSDPEEYQPVKGMVSSDDVDSLVEVARQAAELKQRLGAAAVPKLFDTYQLGLFVRPTPRPQLEAPKSH